MEVHTNNKIQQIYIVKKSGGHAWARTKECREGERIANGSLIFHFPGSFYIWSKQLQLWGQKNLEFGAQIPKGNRVQYLELSFVSGAHRAAGCLQR